jgi:WD domain, G-beta repeat/Eukaryotic translation initiation factor eIF2A
VLGAYRIAVSPDGGTLALADQGLLGNLGISVWDASSGKQRYRFDWPGRRSLFSLVFSPDGKKLAAGSWNNERPNFHLWDLDTGKKLTSCDPDHWVNSIAFSPDGKHVALGSGGDFKTCVSIWDLASAKELQRLINPGCEIVAAFSPSGRFLASGASSMSLANIPNPEQSLVSVWETATGKKVAQFAGHHSGITAVAFAADGRTLASAGGDSSILVWDLVGRLRSKNGRRSLTAAELEARWQDLAGADAAKAFTIIGEFVVAGDEAVAFLKTRLAPVPPPDAAVVRRAAKLTADLNSDKFSLRQKAAAELEKLAGGAIPALRKALADRPSLEVRRRVQTILNGLEGKEAPIHLRQSRALEVLELLATPQARELVAALARGYPEARLTREAATTQSRWQGVRPGSN